VYCSICWLRLHPPLVGIILAYVNRGEAEPLARSHYDFQISTFWRAVMIVVAS